MSQEEYIQQLASLYDSDRKLSAAFADEYHKDSLADKNVLMTRAKSALGRHEGLRGTAEGKNVSPLTAAFDISESGMRDLVDMGSPSNWTRMSSDALLEAAVKGGYVKKLPTAATEEEKQEQRENFGRFLNMLATESTDQGRRNAVSEYENTQFTKDPLGWAQMKINDYLHRTYSKRAKEQARKGEGFSGSSNPLELDVLGLRGKDLAALGGDVAVNGVLGAGAASIGRAVARNGLRSSANILGSDFSAGVLAGLADVANRDINTDEGARGYEYVSEPLLSGLTNTLFTPGALRAGVSSALGMMRGGKVGDISRRNALQKAGDWIANKTGWDEAELSRLFQEMGNPVDWKTAPMSASTRKKISEMKDIWDDGLTDSPGETYSLWDELQSLYESAGRIPIATEKDGVVQNTLFSPEALGNKPSRAKFMTMLDGHIADLQGQLKNEAGQEEQKALQRRIKYFENARDMFGNHLMEPDDALFMVDRPGVFDFRRSPGFNTEMGGTEFKLKKGDADRDLAIMQEYVKNVKEGKNVDVTGPMADELSRLAETYPEFARFVNNMRKVDSGRILGSVYENAPSHGITFGSFVDANKFFPSRAILKGLVNGNARDIARNAASTGAEAVLTGAVKPATTVMGMERYNRPDNSRGALEERIKKLREIKPEATEAALGWKFDNRLDASKQLNAEERNLVNQYRAMLLHEALNGR